MYFNWFFKPKSSILAAILDLQVILTSRLKIKLFIRLGMVKNIYLDTIFMSLEAILSELLQFQILADQTRAAILDSLWWPYPPLLDVQTNWFVNFKMLAC